MAIWKVEIEYHWSCWSKKSFLISAGDVHVAARKALKAIKKDKGCAAEHKRVICVELVGDLDG